MSAAAAVAAIGTLAIAVVAWLTLGPVLRAWRWRRAAANPLSDERRAVLERNVPLRARLPKELRDRVDGLVNAFVAEKEFVGCNGLVITDEVRVTIAAYGCALIVGRPHGLYPELRSILVYPTPFWVEEEEIDESGVVTRHRRVLSGQAWESSRIVLAWEDVVAAARIPAEGYNVVLHEFAHYLDFEALGPAPGPDGKQCRAEGWSQELRAQFDRLVDEIERGAEGFLDPYAAEDEAEFFAVASEEFLERPLALKQRLPETYRLLGQFYGLDPAAWPGT